MRARAWVDLGAEDVRGAWQKLLHNDSLHKDAAALQKSVCFGLHAVLYQNMSMC